MRRRGKRKTNKKLIILFGVIVLLLLGVFAIFVIDKNRGQVQEINKLTEITNHYNEFVKTNKEVSLYDENNKVIGKIGNNVELTLNDIEVTKDTLYFSIKDFEGYYIKYEGVDKIDNLKEIDKRYLNYIPFNQNINTKEITSFYDEDDNLIYSFDKEFSLPIIIKDNGKYGVEYNNRLSYVKEEDVKEVVDSHNTDKNNSSGIGVLNYHAFYDESNAEEKASCPTEICHSKSQFKSHLDFFKENNILTVKMDEVEKYIDGKIRLPKSVLITIDDGPKTKVAVDLLTEYEMYATIFLVSSWFDEDEYYKTDYIEIHSHTHDMHDGGKCPGGQGGAIKCLDENLIQEDLRQSREELGETTAFAYPFYEYNEYSIKMLKEAGFTMAFIGESNYSDNLVHVGSDKFRLRRFVIVTYTTMNDLTRYFKQIK